ncbi:MAG: acylphosphatase [Planctomycetaceae bacterium]
MARRVHVRISGRVQGVFFRASCAEEARSRGLAGWVRNAGDGAVEAEFEGSDDQVGAMLAWCRRGPPSARVADVEATDVDPRGDEGFRITA